jgi:hypothetical protein
VPLSDFGCSWLADELELSPDGEDEEAPLPAEPLGLEELGVELEDEAPPLAESFFCASIEPEDDELDGLLLDGLDGVLVAPDEDEPDGDVDGLVVDDEPVAALLPPPLSHAVSRLAPSAMETATASVDNLMWPPWLGT